MGTGLTVFLVTITIFGSSPPQHHSVPTPGWKECWDAGASIINERDRLEDEVSFGAGCEEHKEEHS